MQNINEASQNVNSCPVVTSKKSRLQPLANSTGRNRPTGPVCAQDSLVATPISCNPQLSNSSIDTIVINCNCVISTRFKIFTELKNLKTVLQSTTNSEVPYETTRSGLFSFNLQRTGVKFFSYVLKCGDIQLCLADRPCDSTMPNLRISIGSLTCNQDLEETVRVLKMWLSHIGISIKTEKVSRLDLCADVLISIKETRAHDEDYCVTRANNHATYRSNRKISGVQIGKGDIVLRIYDKQKEMDEKRNIEKIIFFNGKWGTTFDQPVTRVEFQLRREAIKELMGKGQETTFAAVLFNSKNIWEYLVQNWARFTDSPIDRDNKHQGRPKLSAFWQSIQSAFGSTIASARDRMQKHLNIPDLRKQGAGIMMSIAAGLGLDHKDFFGILATIQDIVREDLVEYMGKVNYDWRFNVKRNNALVSF
jgi:hypothetical protein